MSNMFGATNWQNSSQLKAYSKGLVQNDPVAQNYINAAPQNQSGWQAFTQKINQGWQNFKKPEAAGGFGAANIAQAGLGAINTIANIGLGVAQHKLAKEQLKAQEEQRKIENARYEEQKKRHIQATNDASSTASGLKSAQAQVSKANTPQQSAPQNAENAQPQNNTPQDQPQSAPQNNKELPMERE